MCLTKAVCCVHGSSRKCVGSFPQQKHKTPLFPDGRGPEVCELFDKLGTVISSDHYNREWGFHFPPPPTDVFPFLPFWCLVLMATAWAVLSGGFAEHAVVTIDKKEWGHGGRQCALIITLPASISRQKAFLQNIFFYLIMREANRRASMS